MKICKEYKKDWLAFLRQELDSSRNKIMSEHLKGCPTCQEELKELQNLLTATGSFKDELKQVLDSVNWDSLQVTITEQVWEKRPKRLETKPSSWFFRWKWQPLAAGVILGLLLGVTLTFLVLKPQAPQFRSARTDSKIAFPADFVDRVDLALARRETVDYLERSQYLILEILQSEQPAQVASLLQRDNIQKLLTEKKYLNTQLDDVRLQKAKAICDQIEFLFLELSQLSPELTSVELEKIRNLVEEKQILLKINLVKKELQQSEV